MSSHISSYGPKRSGAVGQKNLAPQADQYKKHQRYRKKIPKKADGINVK